MRHRYMYFVIGFSLFFSVGGYAQIRNPFSHAMRAKFAAQVPAMEELMKGAVEVTSKRALFSSTYKTPDGRIICRSSSQLLNYPDATGKLQPINIELRSDDKGWTADQQPYPSYFRLDRSTAISVGKEGEFDFNIHTAINGSLYDESISSMDKNSVSLDLSSEIHKKIKFGTNGIETDYIIDNSIGSQISISEELKYPAGLKLIRDNMRGKESTDGWCGDYILVSNADNSEAGRFHAPLIYDSKGSWCVGSYNLQEKNGKMILITTVASKWLEKAVYPIVVDPLITGPTAKWTGGSIPSCLFPSFSKDSILVTIPAKVTITQFIINYAYETNENTPVYLPDGKLYFSTSCRNTPADTISCDNQAFEETEPGYCYLTPGSDFHQEYSCCFAPSCDSQTFWLTQHLARLQGGNTCDTNWVWYSKYISPMNPYYQFMATIVGHTAQPDTESRTTAGDTVTPLAQCANTCSLKMTVRTIYGVPPYKISHIWDTTKSVYTVGGYSGCSSGGSKTLTLTLPKSQCPTKCGVNDTIIVPAPLVIDACGDTATGWVKQKIVLKPIPVIAKDTESVCNGSPVNLTLTSCVGGTSFGWLGTDGASGMGNIQDIPFDTSITKPDTVVYQVIGDANGCYDTVSVFGIVNPFPVVVLKSADTIPNGTSANLSVSGGTSYLWMPAANLSCTTCPNPIATPTATTVYYVTVTNKEGCSWLDSIRVVVLDETIIIPNVITPNSGGLNELFVINGLQYFPNSSLDIFDRWGAKVYNSKNYANDWGGGNQSDGVYYYTLTLNNGKKYKGFFQLIK